MTTASLLLALGQAPALAHRAPPGGAPPPGALLIPNLSHGQMQVMAANRAAIMALATARIPTDPTLRRLEAFIALQRFACLWGLVPGAVTDENSPFNECAHAYLAGTRALLMHLVAMPGDAASARALYSAVERQMLDAGASMVLCRFSDEPFTTATRIVPDWRGVPLHRATAATFGGLAALGLGTGTLLVRQLRASRAGPPEGQGRGSGA